MARLLRLSLGLTIEYLFVPSVNVSPDEHSTPNIAQISPGPISLTSCDKLSFQAVPANHSDVIIPPSRHCAF
jgi:hypothetical protein